MVFLFAASGSSLDGDVDGCPNFDKVVEDPLGFGSGHVDTPVTHGIAEVVMPVGSMKGIALIEIHDVGNIGQVVAGATHGLGVEHPVDFVVPLNSGGVGQAGGDANRAHQNTVLIGIEHLVAEVYDDLLADEDGRWGRGELREG